MGGSVGKKLNPTSSNFLGGGTLGSLARKVHPLNRGFLGGGDVGRAGRAGLTFGMSEFGEQNPFGIRTGVNNPLASIYGQNSGASSPNSSIPGPFTLDQAQFDADRAAINAEGQKQYQQSLDFINSDAPTREAARGKLADILQGHARDTFARTLPDIAENSQAAKLYDSTGYGQEVARQQAALGQDITAQLGQQGIQDIYGQSDQRRQALTGLQGYQQAALGRGLSLEDFISQANVAKTIGAQTVPQVSGGKGNAVSGIAAGAGAGSGFGPWGTAIGGGLGGLVGRGK